VAGGDVDVTEIFLQSRRASIYGGSSEILRNVVSRRVLNLPG
jgi:alkylation response protein AidB-like acyl-CoA dehydrogenase